MTEPSPPITLRAPGVGAVLEPAAGGRIAGIRVGGLELLVTEGFGPLAWGAYPMVPWAGRLRDGRLRWAGAEHRLPTHLAPPHAIHGTLVEAPWAVADLAESGATLVADLGPPWPFAGRAVHRVTLASDSLTAALEVTALDEPFPAIVGWHPWFRRSLRDGTGRAVGGPVEIDLPAGAMLRRAADGLPDGTVVRPIPDGPWDDCFTELSGPPHVRWPGAIELTIESGARYWVVYTEQEAGVCIEPQTGPPDGLNTGSGRLVVPGDPLTDSMTLRWRTGGQ